MYPVHTVSSMYLLLPVRTYSFEYILDHKYFFHFSDLYRAG